MDVNLLLGLLVTLPPVLAFVVIVCAFRTNARVASALSIGAIAVSFIASCLLLVVNHAHMDAPRLLAKGGDFMCEKIKEIARAHGVPILHRPELARALFAACEVGQPIPDALFLAVAEVLAMIYRLRRQRAGN